MDAPLSPLLLSTSLAGGAGGAAARLHRELRALGVDSRVLVAATGRGDPTDPHVAHHRPARPVRALRRRAGPRLRRRALDGFADPGIGAFSTHALQSRVHRTVRRMRPDVVHLHWVAADFVHPASVARLPQPLVWTLHDMAPFTGGCHYSGTCEGYTTACGRCPVLGSDSDDDPSRRGFAAKRSLWRGLRLTVVAPSQWLARCAARSALFADQRIEVIPYGIDLSVFAPRSKAECRAALDLPRDAPVLLFGAWGDIPRKGFDLLQRALHRLRQTRADLAQELILLAFGPAPTGAADVPGVLALGRIDDPHELARAYAAADAFVLPSREDNLPTTLIEALACGLPSIGFDIGGVADLIRDRDNGVLVPALDTDALADGLAWLLEDRDRARALGTAARRGAVERHAASAEADAYRTLFAQLLDEARR